VGEDLERAPALLARLAHCVDLVVAGDVAADRERARQLACQLLDAGLQPLAGER
jgi:hypothetical protein